MQVMQWQTKGIKIWSRCSICRVHHLDGSGELLPEEMKIDHDQCLLNYTGNYPQLSTSSAMSKNNLTLVYQRRRQRENSDAVFTATPSANRSEAPSVAPQEHVVSVAECATEGKRSHTMLPVECNEVATASFDRSGDEAGFEEALTTDKDRTLNVCNANGDCSSSKLNLELSSAAFKIDMVSAAECSSSGALVAEGALEQISERDMCMLILRSQGLLDEVLARHYGASTESTGVSSENCYSKSCKVCEHMESTLNMLICDNCEDAFHISCYNPHIKRLPVIEWLCSSCLKKKHKIMKDKSASNCRNGYLASEMDLGSLEFMFKNTEPYMSNVRIGDEFQVDVPDWHECIDEDCNLIGDPLEFYPSRNINMQERDSIQPSKLSSIGNWLQCRAVIEGIGEDVDGTVCGKWRRAPLFEVQNDNWECFRCVLWDSAHADCAVPQELETEEIIKQLKYIEMLRPRLNAKRRKLNDSQDH